MNGTGPRGRSTLRAERLRLKHSVIDANTDLPTLAAVIDDVRRLAEETQAVGLLFLDVGGGQGLEQLHGWQIYDAILRSFAQILRALRADGTLEDSDIICVLSVRSDKFLLFLGGRGREPGGRPSIKACAARVCQRISESLRREPDGPPAAACAFSHGYSVINPDTRLRAERAIHRAIDEAMLLSLRQESEEARRRSAGLDALIETGKISTLYQPILDLRSLAVLGHEAFSRGPAGSPLEDPSALFSLADRMGRLVDVECLCRSRAILRASAHLGESGKLFLNTSAKVLSDPAVSGPDFVRQVEAQGLRHDDIVLEVTERIDLHAGGAHRETLRGLKRQGFGIAIDDMGAGYSSLQSVAEVEPDYLKFDTAFVRNIDRSRIKRSLLETLVDVSERIGAQVIAEGVEMESELQTLRDLGVHLGQGHYLAPPRPFSGGRQAARE